MVEDKVRDKNWLRKTGFPSRPMRKFMFETELPTHQTLIVTGPHPLDEATVSKPFECEASGFLSALEDHGTSGERIHISIVGVVADNWGNRDLKKLKYGSCLDQLCRFWKGYFSS